VSPTRRVLALAALVAAALPPAPAVAIAGGRRSPALRFAAAYDAAEAAEDAAADLLPHLLGTIAEPRIRYELTLAAGADGVAATRRSLNPWVEAIDRDYLASPLRKAAPVGAKDPCCDPCAALPIMRSAQGDLAAGAGQATIDDGGVSWCVEARRTRRGAWRIAKVTRGPCAGTER